MGLIFEKKAEFLGIIRELLKIRLADVAEILVGFEPKNRLQSPESRLRSLMFFEYQLTLNDLQKCFLESTPDNINAHLEQFLSARWERIRNSSMCYTQQPIHPVNLLCLILAIEIFPPLTPESEFTALAPNAGPYLLLMPSIEKSVDLSDTNIHDFCLHEFILSDNERVFIPLADCLEYASKSPDGQFRHVVELDKFYPELTPNEVERICRHSKQADEFYKAIIALKHQRLVADDIGAKLSQLAIQLRGGSVRVGGTGKEFDAGAEATVGIQKFHEYWEALSEPQKLAVFTKTPQLKEILGRLFRPDSVDYQSSTYCVSLIADELDPIISQYDNKKHSDLKLEVEVKKAAFTKFIEDVFPNPALLKTQNKNSPKHILHHLFRLSVSEQFNMFKYWGCANALMYALKYEREALAEFDFTAVSDKAILNSVDHSGFTPLILAAQLGEDEIIRKLLESGLVEINAHDDNRRTALHWAACHGHFESVNRLLDNEACLEAREYEGNTALTLAVKGGHQKVVALLLQRHARVDARNSSGMNSLDIAVERHPELVEPIVMKMSTLPQAAQKECLEYLSFVDSPDPFLTRYREFPNTLFFAANKKTLHLFEVLIGKSLENPNQDILNARDYNGNTPLILAAQLGKDEIIGKLLEPGLVDIHAYDKNKRTALHWAAQHGHLESVNCLLDNDACLEASEDEGNTALTLAVKGGHKEVVELLLQRNARVDTRNSSGKNALDIALARRGYWEYKFFPNCDLVEPILMQLAKCSEDVQAECLRCASGGPYDNVYSYTFTKRPDLFDYLMLSLSSMNTDALESAIDRHPELIEPILRRWAILDPALQNRCLLKFSHEAYDDVYSYVLTERPEFFNSLNSYEEPDYILTAMRFNEHLQCICTHYQLMKAKSQDNSNYIIAAEAAKTLLIECAKAKDALGGSHDVNQIRLFQETCKRAIENAKPVLKKYREWGKVLAAFLLVIITFPISLPLAAMGFFSVKTKSEQLLDKLNKAIECDRPLSYQGNSV